MWEFRRNPQDLSQEDKVKLEGLFAKLPRLRTLYDIRVRFQQIFDTAADRRSALRLLTGLWLDILEHFTREELYPLLESVTARLAPGGRLIASVPNADSPHASRAIYADITHEIAFTPTSLSELFFCHGLKVLDFRDPWPAPVSLVHKGYRALSLMMRGLEGARLRLLGFDAPRYWSSVIWVVAEKPQSSARPGEGHGARERASVTMAAAGHAGTGE